MLETNTLLDVANSALILAGDRAIEKLNDTSDKTSMQVSALLRQAILDVESAATRPWRELYVSKNLVLREDDPVYDEWVFNKPTDCLCVIRVGNGAHKSELDYREEGNLIYIPASAFPGAKNTGIRCCYSKLSLDPQEWGADLRGCVIALLTARLAGVLSATPAISQNLENAFWQGEFVRRTGNSIVNTEGRNSY